MWGRQRKEFYSRGGGVTGEQCGEKEDAKKQGGGLVDFAEGGGWGESRVGLGWRAMGCKVTQCGEYGKKSKTFGVERRALGIRRGTAKKLTSLGKKKSNTGDGVGIKKPGSKKIWGTIRNPVARGVISQSEKEEKKNFHRDKGARKKKYWGLGQWPRKRTR